MSHDIKRLRDVIEGDLEIEYEGEYPTADVVEYRGLFIMPQGSGSYNVTPEGFADSVLKFDADEYDDVLELVDDLNREADELMALSHDDLVEEYGAIVSTGPAPDDVELTRDPEEYRELRGKA